MDPQYGSYYRRLYEEHWWWRMRERWVLEAIRRATPVSGWRNILDVGCGDALFFDRLSEFGNVEGIEPDRHLVSPDNPFRSRIIVGPFDNSFQPNKRYGLILMLDVLEHLRDPQAALHHVVALLEDKGTLIITVPAYKAAWTNHDVMNYHLTRYRKSTLFPLIQAAGLRETESAYWFHLTFPVKIAQRAVQYIFKMAPQKPVIPSLRMNRLLMTAFSIEHAITSKLHIPFGTTLFVRCNLASHFH